jgi:hypothetical protein
VFWYFSFMRGMFWYISKFYRNIRELYEIYQIVPERKFYGIPLGKNPRTTTASKRAKYIRSFFAKSLASSIRVRIRDRNRGDLLWRPAAACFKEKVLARLETWRSITWFRGVHCVKHRRQYLFIESHKLFLEGYHLYLERRLLPIYVLYAACNLPCIIHL